MASFIDLAAADGFKLPAYLAAPAGQPKGAVVVLQEIFGVNSHIRSVADGYAAAGYLAIAPATFHRAQAGVELGYAEPDFGQGVGLKAAVEALPAPGVLQDIQAAIDHVRQATAGKVGIVGYCWGGTLAWLCATRLNVACAVGYYGSGTIDVIDEKPACPVTLMLGEKDQSFPPGNIAAIRKAHQKVTVFTYPAGHGFACDHRDAWHAASAAQARERTLDVLTRYLG